MFANEKFVYALPLFDIMHPSSDMQKNCNFIEKGLKTDDVLVVNAEKQRTLARKK